MVAEIARKIKRYFINDAKSFGSCSLHPYSFRWVTIALSYGDSRGARSTQFAIRNLIFPDDLVVFEQGNQPWSRFGSSHFELLDEELELSFGFLRVQPVTNRVGIYPTATAFSELACEISRETLDRCIPKSRAASAALVLPEFTIRRISVG